MNNQTKPPRSAIARIAEALGGLAGALSRVRLIGREMRGLAEDLAHIPEEMHTAQATQPEETPHAEQHDRSNQPESGDVIDRKLERIKPSQPFEGEFPPDWNMARPQKLPRPTYWPAVLAGGVVVFAWGPPTSWTVSVVGAVVSIIAIRGWIGELRRESKSE